VSEQFLNSTSAQYRLYSAILKRNKIEVFTIDLRDNSNDTILAYQHVNIDEGKHKSVSVSKQC